MTNPALPRNRKPAIVDPVGALAKRIQDLERNLKETQQQLGAFTGMTFSGNQINLGTGTEITVEDGALNVEGGNGVQVTEEGGITVHDQATNRGTFYAGIYNDGSGQFPDQMIFEVFRDDGTAGLICADLGTTPGHPHQQAVQWFDRTGNIVIADDTTSGVGLASPWIPAGAFVDYLAAPTAVTASATYASIQISQYYKQHPKLVVALVVRSDAGTTGNVRIVDELNNVIGTPIAVPAASFFIGQIGPVAMPGGFGDSKNLFIQAQRTAGTGNIGVRGMSAYGIQS